jgi:ABC-type transport system substrate-binding protein
MNRTRIAALFAFVMVVAAACGSGAAGRSVSSDPASPTRGGKVVVGTYGEVDGFNPLKSQWSGPAYQIARTVLDPLVVMDRAGARHEVRGTKGVLLPAWSDNGRRLAWLTQQGRKKFVLTIADVAAAQ